MAKIADNVILIYNSYLWLIIASIIIDWSNNKIPFYQFSNYFSNNDIKRSLHALPSIFKKSKRDNYLKKKKRRKPYHIWSLSCRWLKKLLRLFGKVNHTSVVKKRVNDHSLSKMRRNERRREDRRGWNNRAACFLDQGEISCLLFVFPPSRSPLLLLLHPSLFAWCTS